MVGSDIAYGNGLFIVPSSFMHTGLLVTPDGSTWVRRSVFPDTGIENVAFGNGTYVVSCSGGAYPAGIYQSELVSTPFLSIQPLNSTANILNVSGEIGRNYSLQTSSDLRSWSDLLSWSNTTASTQFVAQTSSSSPQLFYRARTP